MILQYIILIFFLLTFTSCSGNSQETQVEKPDSVQLLSREDTAKTQEPEFASENIEPELKRYKFIPVINSLLKEEFLKHTSPAQVELILAINRIDRKNLWKIDSIVAPVEHDSFLNFSPFPHKIESAREIEKLIVFSYPSQAFAAYEYGKLIRWGPTSMGRLEHLTPTGLFSVNWQAEITVSTINSDWILPWNMNIHNLRGISMHQYDLPGYPASHACTRLYESDAKWLYNWVDTWILDKKGINRLAHGTPVIIYGEYDFNAAEPWKLLPENPAATAISASNLNEIIKEYKNDILERQNARNKLLGITNEPA
jgi:hypothetical protein